MAEMPSFGWESEKVIPVGSIACIIDINYIYLQGGASCDNECYCHDYRYLIELYVHIKEFA